MSCSATTTTTTKKKAQNIWTDMLFVLLLTSPMSQADIIGEGKDAESWAPRHHSGWWVHNFAHQSLPRKRDTGTRQKVNPAQYHYFVLPCSSNLTGVGSNSLKHTVTDICGSTGKGKMSNTTGSFPLLANRYRWYNWKAAWVLSVAFCLHVCVCVDIVETLSWLQPILSLFSSFHRSWQCQTSTSALCSSCIRVDQGVHPTLLKDLEYYWRQL